MKYRFGVATWLFGLGFAALALSSKPVLSPQTAWTLAITFWVIGALVFIAPLLRSWFQSRKPSRVIPINGVLALITRHFAKEWGPERFKNAKAALAAQLLRLSASRGDVIVEGHEEIDAFTMNTDRRFSKLPQEIHKDYWLTHTFKLETILNRKATKQVETEPESRGATGPNYGMLRVSETTVKKHWPTPLFREAIRNLMCRKKDEP